MSTCQLFGFFISLNTNSLLEIQDGVMYVPCGFLQCSMAQKTNGDGQTSTYIVILWLGEELYLNVLWLQRHPNYLHASHCTYCRISHLLAHLEHSKLKAKVPPPQATSLTTKK